MSEMEEQTEPQGESAPEGQGEQTSTEEQAAQWFWAEGVPGEGPKPDFLPEKFNNVAEAAKARNELEKKLGSFTGAPDEYKLDHLGLDPDQHMLKEITDVAKDMNMSQEGLDKFVGRLLTAQQAESEKSLEDEVNALGKEGPQLMRQFKYFQENNLKAEESEVVKNWIQSADDLKVFNSLVQGIYNKPIPTENSTHLNNHHESVDSLQQEMAKNKQRFDTDATYRKDWHQRLEYALARENR